MHQMDTEQKGDGTIRYFYRRGKNVDPPEREETTNNRDRQQQPAAINQRAEGHQNHPIHV